MKHLVAAGRDVGQQGLSSSDLITVTRSALKGRIAATSMSQTNCEIYTLFTHIKLYLA